MTEGSSLDAIPQSKTESEKIHHTISTQIKRIDKHESTQTDPHAAENYSPTWTSWGYDVCHKQKPAILLPPSQPIVSSPMPVPSLACHTAGASVLVCKPSDHHSLSRPLWWFHPTMQVSL